MRQRHSPLTPWLLVAAAVLLLLQTACAPVTPAPVENRTKSHHPASVKHTKSKERAKKGFYRVKKGDTLYSIAWRHNLDYKHLAIWNRVKPPYTIIPGSQLRLSPPPLRKAGKTPARKPASMVRAPAVADTPRAPVGKPAPKPKPEPAAAPVRRPVELSKPAVVSANLRWTWPTKGKLVMRFRKGDKTRQGIRIAGTPGQPVRAAEAGEVVYSGSGLPGYGKLIIIKHNKNYLSAYGFNRKMLVREGRRVARGAAIAEMGRAPDGKPLLHFEIRRSDTVVDPLGLLPRR